MIDVTVVKLDSENADEYLQLYREFEWWADRERADVEQALENTSLAIGLRDGNELVAAARVLSDFVYYAKVYDVIVTESRRGDGLGEQLMKAVTEHPDLGGINLTLNCREGLVPFYEWCGFKEHDVTTEIVGPEEGFVRMTYWREGECP